MLHSGLSSRLDQVVEVLALREGPIGTWAWETARKTWGQVKLTAQRKSYTTVGVWARGAELVLRRQDLTPHNALRWRGKHLFLTSVILEERDRLAVEAAVVELSACEDKMAGLRFPAVMTEKYLGHEEREPYDVNMLRHVLVTPKAVQLKPGRLVEVDGTPWPIRVAHTLDPWHNEYELEREVDL